MSEAVQWPLKAIPTYVLTFGRVFVAPKTEIVAKCRGEESAVPDALVFLGVSQWACPVFSDSEEGMI